MIITAYEIYIFFAILVVGGFLFVTDTAEFQSDSENKYFETQYLGRNFTKADIDNPEIFNISEISKYINQGIHAYNYKTIKLVKTGMRIVNENNNFSLRLHNKIGQSEWKIIYLNDNERDYEIYYYGVHIEDKIRLSTTLNNRLKKYLFTDLSQVELYFDMKREYGKC
jgi:hypothetical protein